MRLFPPPFFGSAKNQTHNKTPKNERILLVGRLLAAAKEEEETALLEYSIEKAKDCLSRKYSSSYSYDHGIEQSFNETTKEGGWSADKPGLPPRQR
jgi:hypothetical protein